jgi:hypothetical protein
MSESASRARERVEERVLRGPGVTPPEARQDAFHNTGPDGPVQQLIDRVAQHAWTVTDEDVEAAKRAGASDDELFELVVCAAIGQASRQLDAALAAVQAALAEDDAQGGNPR